MRRLAWTFAARIGDKYQICLTRSICLCIWSSFNLLHREFLHSRKLLQDHRIEYRPEKPERGGRRSPEPKYILHLPWKSEQIWTMRFYYRVLNASKRCSVDHDLTVPSGTVSSGPSMFIPLVYRGYIVFVFSVTMFVCVCVCVCVCKCFLENILLHFSQEL